MKNFFGEESIANPHDHSLIATSENLTFRSLIHSYEVCKYYPNPKEPTK